jgi:CheY-like chemotaxis protein
MQDRKPCGTLCRNQGYLIAIIDLNMPRMGGSEFMRTLHSGFDKGDYKSYLDTRFILSTAQSDGDAENI